MSREFVLHPGDAGRERRQHAEPRSRRQRRLEHRLVRLQDRHARAGGGGLDRLAKGRAGEEDGVGAIVLGIARQKEEAPDHRLGQPAFALAVARQRGVEDVDIFRLGPEFSKGGVHRRHGDGDGMDQRDAGHPVLWATAATAGC